MVSLWVTLYFGSGKPNDVHVMVTDELRKAGFVVKSILVLSGLSVNETNCLLLNEQLYLEIKQNTIQNYTNSTIMTS